MWSFKNESHLYLVTKTCSQVRASICPFGGQNWTHNRATTSFVAYLPFPSHLANPAPGIGAASEHTPSWFFLPWAFPTMLLDRLLVIIQVSAKMSSPCLTRIEFPLLPVSPTHHLVFSSSSILLWNSYLFARVPVYFLHTPPQQNVSFLRTEMIFDLFAILFQALSIRHRASGDFPGDTSGKERACQCRGHKRRGLILASWRSPGEGHGNPLQYFACRTPWTEEPGGLQSIGSQRVGHDWSDLACTHAQSKCPVTLGMNESTCPRVNSISAQIHRSWNKKPNRILFPGFTIDSAAPSGGVQVLLLHPGHAIHEKPYWFQASHPNTHLPLPHPSQLNLSSILIPLPGTTQPLSCSGYNTHGLTSCLLLPVLGPLWSFLHTTVFANKIQPCYSLMQIFVSLHGCPWLWKWGWHSFKVVWSLLIPLIPIHYSASHSPQASHTSPPSSLTSLWSLLPQGLCT